LTSLPQINQDDYYDRSYEDISKEFQTLFPSAMRAYQLIPLMYNRLTLVDNLSHTEAVQRIHNDHINLPGFSARSIRRYLPADNPTTPHRVRPSCPKKSPTQTDKEEKLSNNEQCKVGKVKEDLSTTDFEFLNNSKSSLIESESQKLDNLQEIEDEKQRLAKRVTILLDLCKKYKAEIDDLKQMISKGSFVAADQISSKTGDSENILFEYSVGVEDVRQYISSITANEGSCEILWFNGSFNKDTGNVTELSLGRMTAK
jgi:hypothetical protein